MASESKHQKAIQPDRPFEMEGATGASDANSGGGAGAGIPDAELDMRTGGRVERGDLDADREKLFPEAKGKSVPTEKIVKRKH
jgi:hypothetical protein